MSITNILKKSSMVAAGATLIALGIGEVAKANVLTFDDISNAPYQYPIYNGYGGLNWSNFGVVADYYSYGSGYDNGTVSGAYTAYHGYGQPANISGRLFDFNGAYLTSAWDSFLNIEVRGYRGGQLTNSQVVTANRNAPTWFNFNYFDIDRLEFISYGLHIAMDNLTINAPRLREFYLNGSNSNITISEGQSVQASLTATDREFSTDFISFFINGNAIGTAPNYPYEFHPDGWYVDRTWMGTSLGTFSDNSTFTYTAQARDQFGTNGNTISRTVTVLNVAPTLTGLNLSNNTILEGQSATATLSATDPGADTISFLLNGNNIGTNTNTSGIRSLTTSLGTFADNGTVTYTGQARDDDGGLSGTVSQTLTILNVAPTLTGLNLSSNTILEGQSATATLSATDPGADTVSFLLNGNNVGTNTNTSGTRSLTTSLGPFADNGTVTYTGQARDDDGGLSSTVSQTLTILNVAPTLTAFDLSSYEIYEGQSISALIKAIDPGADAISFWINGINVGADAATSGIRSLNANLGIFADDGTFAINGQAQDDDGGISSILSKYLKVLNVDPVINSLTSGLFGRQLNFSAIATDAGVNDLLSFAWDFDGDGEYNDFFGDSGVWDFQKNGLYKVGLKVADGDGGFAYSSFNVEVSVPEPASMLGLLAIGALGAGSAFKRRKSVS